MGKQKRLLVIAAACGIASGSILISPSLAALVASPPPDGYKLVTVSPTGPDYDTPQTGGGFVHGVDNYATIYDPQQGFLQQNFTPLNASGHVAGWTMRKGQSLGQDAWYFDGTSTHLLGLTGAGYQYTTPSGGTYRDSQPRYMNASGNVVGVSSRYAADGSQLGNDVWISNAGAAPVIISPTSSDYSYTTLGGTYRAGLYSIPLINNSGSVVGTARRFASNGSDLGNDAWLYNGTTTQILGLTGSGYQYTTPNGTFRDSGGSTINDSASVAGQSQRFAADGTSLGFDAWVYNGSNYQTMGLTGSGNQYTLPAGTYRYSYVDSINASGHVTGYSQGYATDGTDLGTNTWYYNGSSTKQTNLTGAGYEYSVAGGKYRQAATFGLTASGQIVGMSYRYASDGSDLGQDLWAFNGSSTKRINLAGTGYDYNNGLGTYRYSDIKTAAATGHVLGVSNRYANDGSDLGTDSWFYDGSTTKVINPTSGFDEFTTPAGKYRSGVAYSLNASEHAVGIASRFAADGSDLGVDAWYYNGSTTQVIALTGPGYEYSAPGGAYHDSRPSAFSDNNIIVGTSARYAADGSGLGQAGFYFDPTTNVTTPLAFSFRSDGYCLTVPMLLTDNDVVLGGYDVFNGSTLVGFDLFGWNPTSGFYDLGTLIQGGSLAANGWQSLDFDIGTVGTFQGGFPTYIFGQGKRTGENTTATTFALIAQVPEPTSFFLLVSSTSLLLLRRRSRRQ